MKNKSEKVLLLHLFSWLSNLVGIQDMMSIISSHHCNWSLGIHQGGRSNKIPWSGLFTLQSSLKGRISSPNLGGSCCHRVGRRCRPVFSSVVDSGNENEADDDEDSGDRSKEKESAPGPSEGGVFKDMMPIFYFFLCFPLQKH